jgi:transposase
MFHFASGTGHSEVALSRWDRLWAVIRPMLPDKRVPRVDDRRVLNGIFWILRSGAPWRALPVDFGPYTTCYNRFVHGRRAGVLRRIMTASAGAHSFCGLVAPIACYTAFSVDLDSDARVSDLTAASTKHDCSPS